MNPWVAPGFSRWEGGRGPSGVEGVVLAEHAAHRRAVGRVDAVGVADAHAEVPQQAVLDAVDPAVHGDVLAAGPGVLDDGGLAYAQGLLDDIEFAHPDRK